SHSRRGAEDRTSRASDRAAGGSSVGSHVAARSGDSIGSVRTLSPGADATRAERSRAHRRARGGAVERRGNRTALRHANRRRHADGRQPRGPSPHRADEGAQRAGKSVLIRCSLQKERQLSERPLLKIETRSNITVAAHCLIKSHFDVALDRATPKSLNG